MRFGGLAIHKRASSGCGPRPFATLVADKNNLDEKNQTNRSSQRRIAAQEGSTREGDHAISRNRARRRQSFLHGPDVSRAFHTALFGEILVIDIRDSAFFAATSTESSRETGLCFMILTDNTVSSRVSQKLLNSA